jgi:hypothetical protein
MARLSETKITITMTGREWFRVSVALYFARQHGQIPNERDAIAIAETKIDRAIRAASATADREGVVIPFSAREV